MGLLLALSKIRNVIIDTDPGCQFTSEAFTSVPKTWDVKINPDHLHHQPCSAALPCGFYAVT
jgi:hypothetical protein